MLQYFQFPKFLLKLRISQTAKFLYMILYDRARISRKNSWIDKNGNVYLIFPIDELSVQIGKCKFSVKTALKELDDEELLVRRSGGFSKPNITPHVCRHTYCTNMAKSGMNPKALQYLMGHSEISVTLNTYTHVNLEDAREEIARIQVV